jgi:hypothetical protein
LLYSFILALTDSGSRTLAPGCFCFTR